LPKDNMMIGLENVVFTGPLLAGSLKRTPMPLRANYN